MNKRLGWAKAPFEHCLEHLGEVDRVLHLCQQGLAHLTKIPNLAKALVELESETGEDEPPAEGAARIEELEASARFAEEEIAGGFPTLHAHSVIALWGALEVVVTDLATIWLLKHPDTLGRKKFSKIKIPLAEYETLEKEDRMRILLKELSRALGADFKIGIGRFEAILDPMGLGGPVDEKLRRDLFEMSEVRNVLVHRGGVGDRRLCEACPWLEFVPGERLRIDHKTYHRYLEAVQGYVLALINRVRVASGLKPYEKRADENSEQENGAE